MNERSARPDFRGKGGKQPRPHYMRVAARRSAGKKNITPYIVGGTLVLSLIFGVAVVTKKGPEKADAGPQASAVTVEPTAPPGPRPAGLAGARVLYDQAYGLIGQARLPSGAVDKQKIDEAIAKLDQAIEEYRKAELQAPNDESIQKGILRANRLKHDCMKMRPF